LSHGTRLCALVLLTTALGCEGSASQSGLVRLDAEPAGNNCANGGSAVHAGIDADANGTLSDDEVESTQYVCNGAPGSEGPAGAGGAAGADGDDGDDGDP